MNNGSMPLVESFSISGDCCSFVIGSSLKGRFVKDDFWYRVKGVDLSAVPSSILYVPFLLNIAPIVWVSGEVLHVDEMDENLAQALELVKAGFERMYPEVDWSGDIVASAKVKADPLKGLNKSCLLFSGGLDSVATSYRHMGEEQVLVTVRGSDVKLDDDIGWYNVTQAVESYSGLINAKSCLVESNFAQVPNSRVLNNLYASIPSWWVYVQHGIGLSGLMAVPAFINEAGNGYIASSHSEEFKDKPWGSTPKIDNLVRWGAVQVYHDSYDLTRQGKIKLVVKEANLEGQNKPELRVCYVSDGGENCCKCEKCSRTMTGLLVAGDDYDGYGFDMPVEEHIELVKTMFSGVSMKFDENTRFQWKDIQNNIQLGDNSGILENYLVWLKSFDFDLHYQKVNSRIDIKKAAKRIVKSIPGLYSAYQKFR